MGDFSVKKGLLCAYTGPKSGSVVIPEEAKGFDSPVFVDIMEDEFTLTLPNGMNCTAGDLLSQEISVLNIPAGATVTIRGDRFNGNNGNPFFKKLREINVDPDHPDYSSENGVLYNRDKTVLISCPRAVSGKVVIPDSVTEIGEQAFYGCASVTEVVIPSGVTEIKEKAFADCKSLKKIVLPESVKKIGAEAFLRCAKLTTAGLKGTGDKKGYAYEFPWTEIIPENAFNGMKSLKSVVLPDTIKEIGKNAFKACGKLEQINLSANVKFDKKTFKNCKLLNIAE